MPAEAAKYSPVIWLAGAGAGRAEIDLAGIGFCVSDQFGNGLRRE